ncbi:MAG: AIM24 family protein [Bacteroidales bacterium]
MNYKLSSYPNSFLKIDFDPGERIIIESGALLYSSGEYSFEKKYEAKSMNSWIAKLFGGKSLTYNVYTAKDSIDMVFSPKQNSEVLMLEVEEDKPIVFRSSAHFARTQGLEVALTRTKLKSKLFAGLKLKTFGSGTLFLKAFGRILKQEIDSDKPLYVDEDALLAYDSSIQVKAISKGLKETVTSGEGYLFTLQGRGRFWLQTRKKPEKSGGNGIIGVIVDAF